MRSIIIATISLTVFITIMASSTENLEMASLWGKYDTLIEKIQCPDVKWTQNPFWLHGFKEYGKARAKVWCKGKRGKAGYYVYVKPYWYGWKNINKNWNKDKVASANGKYSGLMKKLRCPGNKGFYKEFTDYGYQPSELWCGGWVKPGYMTYVYPYWYAWKNYRHRGEIPEKASEGKKYIYSNLIQVIRCEKDASQYGKVYEYGTHDQNTIYCNQQHTAPGYWFYVSPNWYIWKTRTKREGW